MPDRWPSDPLFWIRITIQRFSRHKPPRSNFHSSAWASLKFLSGLSFFLYIFWTHCRQGSMKRHKSPRSNFHSSSFTQSLSLSLSGLSLNTFPLTLVDFDLTIGKTLSTTCSKHVKKGNQCRKVIKCKFISPPPPCVNISRFVCEQSDEGP